MTASPPPHPDLPPAYSSGAQQPYPPGYQQPYPPGYQQPYSSGSPYQPQDPESQNPQVAPAGNFRLFFTIGLFAGLLIGPLIFLALCCWSTNPHGGEDSSRKGFIYGASLGIILSVMAFVIVFSISKFFANE